MTVSTLTEEHNPFVLDTVPETLTDAFERMVAKRPDAVAVRSHDTGVAWTWRELAARVAEAAAGFHAMGLRRGDTAALFLRNRPDFYVVDLALVRLGVVPFSLYATSSPPQHDHVLGDSGATIVIAEQELLPRLAEVTLPARRVVIDGDAPEGWESWGELIARGAGVDISEVERPRAEDLLTLIYTSGTTGTPKGVMLSHRNSMAASEANLDALRIPEGSVAISWLPAAHTGDRCAYAIAMVQGLELVTVQDPRAIADAVPDIHPHWFFGPPRVFEKLRGSFNLWLDSLPAEEGERVRAGLAASELQVRLEQESQEVPASVAELSREAREVLLMPWKRSVGLDRVLVAVVATAPNPGQLMSFYHALGIPMGESYGLSECAAGTISYPHNIRIGTVGQVTRTTELRIAPDGEVLLRGPAVMVGYLNRPEATREAIDDEGWLHTGDLGSLDDDGFLRIVGRKKDVMISASGKNISPVAVEGAILSATSLIGQVCCVGDGRPYNAALIALDVEYARGWAAQRGIEATTVEELATNELVIKEVAAAVEAGNATLNRPEQIKKFHIVPREWIPGRELTPTSKMRRNEILSMYEAEVETLYGTT